MSAPRFQHVTPAFRTFCGADALAALPRELDRVGASRVVFCGDWAERHADALGRVRDPATGERLALFDPQDVPGDLPRPRDGR